MDTIYSNKNYSQRLKAGNDFYRSCTIKPMANNDYILSPATMDRRSNTLGPSYSHMTMSKYSMQNDSSNYNYNNYGYSTWGAWNDNKTLAPSLSSYNKQKSIKSFTMILMTAALIVVLAVISIAGLAFYFSSYRSDGNDSILVFDGNFLVTRGDIYTPGLKYNQTTLYRQKSQFYDRLIRTALENRNLVITKCEINNFGNGPSIVVDFRIFLDMRQIPLTINNVEQHIATALIDEISSPVSDFKNIRIDADSIEIKRILDKDVLRDATLFYEIPTPDSSVSSPSATPNYTSSVLTEKEKLMKKSGFIEKTVSRFKPNIAARPKTSTPSRSPTIRETEIDLENLPVIQGSFEITKTEADITRRKGIPTTPGHRASTSTQKPFMVTPGSIKVKEKVKSGVRQDDTVKYHTAMIEKVTSAKPILSTTTTMHPEISIDTTTEKSPETTTSSGQTIPVLDVRLFTSAPVIDNAPWHPITPAKAPNDFKNIETTIPATTSTNSPPHQQFDDELLQVIPLEVTTTTITTTVMPTTHIPTTNGPPLVSEAAKTENPNYFFNYKSYTNPEFSTSSFGIEKLGTANVRPFPIPVNKLQIEEIPPPPKYYDNLDSLNQDLLEGKDTDFGHDLSMNKTSMKKNEENKTANPFAIHLSEILYDFLEIRDDNSRTATFLNSKNGTNSSKILDAYAKHGDSSIESDLDTELPMLLDSENTESITEPEFVTTTSVSKTVEEVTSKPMTTEKYPPTTDSDDLRWSEVALFPINGGSDRINESAAPMRKVFNETLQAFIIENEDQDLEDDIKNDKNLTKADSIQNISTIFDHLSSKLGIQPNVSMKNPPFASISKLKSNLAKNNRTASTSSTTYFTTSSTERFEPIERFSSTVTSNEENGTPIEVGQAEIEEIDPSIFEEMLKQQSQRIIESTTPTVQLITLLPVKSNVGIHNFKRPNSNSQRAFSSHLQPPPMKSFSIKTSINVENK